MKWNILVASMVLGLGLSTQSFGFDLLDRMLDGSGHEQKGSARCGDKDALQKACQDGCVERGGIRGLRRGCAQRACCDPNGDPKNGDCHVQRAGLGRGLLNGCAARACDPKDGKTDDTKGDTKNGKRHVQRAGLGLGLLNGCAARACDPKDGKTDDTKGDTKNGKRHVQRAGLGLGLLNGCAARACDPKDGKTDDTKGDTKNGKCHVQRAGLGLGLLGGHAQKACHDPNKGGIQDLGCAQKGTKAPRICGPSLLERIFSSRRICCDPKGGNNGKGGKDDMKTAPTPANQVPMPPAPVVDAAA